MTETAEPTVTPCLADPIEVDSGVPGITLVHFPVQYLVSSGLPSDGEWSTTWATLDLALGQAKFRTLHAAAHYAHRIKDIPGAMEFLASATREAKRVAPELAKALNHAEAHAHEVDAVYPVGGRIEFSNGPGIVDVDGTIRQFLDGSPSVEFEKNADGEWCCAECGDPEATPMAWRE